MTGLNVRQLVERIAILEGEQVALREAAKQAREALKMVGQ